MENKKYYIFKMSLGILNIFSILLLIVMVGIGLLFYKDFYKDFIDGSMNLGIFLILFILYMVLHEILHSISYVLNGAKFKNITYGVHLEKNILCCLCKQDITKRNILISLFTPLVLIGIVTFIVGAIFKLPTLYILSIINISGCIGDIIMFIFISRLDKDIKYAEFDDPTAFAILSRKDLSKRKPFGLIYVEKKEKLEQKDYKKVTVSGASILYIIFLMLMSGIMYFLR